MSDQSPSKGRDSRLAISGWPLRSKVALALAIPLLLAATFGGLRVTNDLERVDQRLRQPAAGHRHRARDRLPHRGREGHGGGPVVHRHQPGRARRRGGRDQGRRRRADQGPLDAPTSPPSRDARSTSSSTSAAPCATTTTGPLSPGTWIAQLRQMQSGVTKLITTIINEQLTPEPRLELLSQTLSGRFSLAQQQAIAASQRTGRNVDVALFAEYGAESVALDRLAGQRGVADTSIQTLRINNAPARQRGRQPVAPPRWRRRLRRVRQHPGLAHRRRRQGARRHRVRRPRAAPCSTRC